MGFVFHEPINHRHPYKFEKKMNNEVSQSSFDQLDLIAPILRAVRGMGYKQPTPVQQAAIPPLLEGRDLLGCSQTGTGKTAAFALPILQRLHNSGQRATPGSTRSLVLTPTRELAMQIADSFRNYGRYMQMKMTVVVGGVSARPQIQACSRGLDILVATPGRLLDLVSQRRVRLDKLEVIVLDEADRMLDMGFLPDVKRLIAMIPQKRQSLFFSATMPPAIARLADGILTDPAKVQITPAATPVQRIDQRVLFVSQAGKRPLLEELLKDSEVERALVFTRTKHGANRVVQQLVKSRVRAEAIHGNKSQSARLKALADFRNGRIKVLVATDIASRGIDVEGITHVINYDLPNEPESYVHRIGRTARAGAEGVAISFCNTQEKSFLRSIQRLIKQAVPVHDPSAYGFKENNQPTPLTAADKKRPAPAARQRPPRRNKRSPKKAA